MAHNALERPRFSIARNLSDEKANHTLELAQNAYTRPQFKTLRVVGIAMRTVPVFTKGRIHNPDTVLEDWIEFSVP